MTSLHAVPHGIEYLSIRKTEQLNRLSAIVADLFKKSGFQEITPPLVDYASTFNLAQRGGLGTNFEFRDGSGEYLSLRSDLTVQTLKAALTGRTGIALTDATRLFYVQRILKDCSPGSGQLREILQAGAEWIGEHGGDRFEALHRLAAASLDALGFSYRFLYGDARFVEILLSFVPETERASLADTLYYKDTGRLIETLDRLNIHDDRRTILIEAPLLVGDLSILSELRKICKSNQSLVSIIDEAPRFDDLLYDFVLVRQLSYYSGPVIEAYLQQSNRRVLSGGFYDDLSLQFTDKPVKASGFAINLNELLFLTEAGNQSSVTRSQV